MQGAGRCVRGHRRPSALIAEIQRVSSMQSASDSSPRTKNIRRSFGNWRDDSAYAVGTPNLGYNSLSLIDLYHTLSP